ncbi:M15 family metallopeptidase [Haliangium sp.]|uniref:M15 family metallopeptidase n=1 Tax=Haliangium sp. TaxID=2663208 RepID=UPI003D0C8917
MSLPSFVIKAAQHASDAEVDGLLGPKTLAALREYDDECDDFDFADERNRLVVAVAQHASGLRGKDLDGRFGPTTKQAVQAYLERHGVEAANTASPAAAPAAAPAPAKADANATPAAPARSSKSSGSKMAVWEAHEGPGIYEKDGIDLRDPTPLVPEGGLAEIPTRKTMKGVYGDALELGKEGIKERLVSLDGLPGRFNKGNGELHSVHKLMAPHLRLALELCEKFGVIDEIYRIGTFNYRHMRHDPSKPLSFHSYGVCVDLNPRENFGWVPNGDEKNIQPFSEGWWKKYPRSLSEVAVLCFKKAGFAWGGDWASFRDPMHFELVA